MGSSEPTLLLDVNALMALDRRLAPPAGAAAALEVITP